MATFEGSLQKTNVCIAYIFHYPILVPALTQKLSISRVLQTRAFIQTLPVANTVKPTDHRILINHDSHHGILQHYAQAELVTCNVISIIHAIQCTVGTAVCYSSHEC